MGIMSKSIRKPRSSAKRWYKGRVKKSMCKGKDNKQCKKVRGCRFINGKTRKYCRKIKNKRRSLFKKIDLNKNGVISEEEWELYKNLLQSRKKSRGRKSRGRKSRVRKSRGRKSRVRKSRVRKSRGRKSRR